jgi:hypothetical protein
VPSATADSSSAIENVDYLTARKSKISPVINAYPDSIWIPLANASLLILTAASKMCLINVLNAKRDIS